MEDGYFDPVDRARQKQAARDEDQRALASGEVTAAELRKRNSFFGGLDMANFKMVLKERRHARR